MWAYDGADARGPLEWESLEEGLRFVLDRLWPHREVLAKYKVSYELIWWCGHFQTSFDGGPRLTSSLLVKLGELGADLFIDNYSSATCGEEKE
jgi:hypothetical protein